MGELYDIFTGQITQSVRDLALRDKEDRQKKCIFWSLIFVVGAGIAVLLVRNFGLSSAWPAIVVDLVIMTFAILMGYQAKQWHDFLKKIDNQ